MLSTLNTSTTTDKNKRTEINSLPDAPLEYIRTESKQVVVDTERWCHLPKPICGVGLLHFIHAVICENSDARNCSWSWLSRHVRYDG